MPIHSNMLGGAYLLLYLTLLASFVCAFYPHQEDDDVTHWRRNSRYDPDHDAELTLPRTPEEIEFQVHEIGATIDPMTNQTRYDGFKLLRAHPSNDQHLKALRLLEEDPMCDVWSDIPRNVTLARNIDVMVSPKNTHLVEHFLLAAGIHYDVIFDNVEDEIEKQRRTDEEPLPRDASHQNASEALCLKESGMSFSSYRSFKAMYRYMECLTGVYPNMLKMIEIGKSFEGRPLVVLKISGSQPGIDESGGKRKVIWIDANIHSREWITSASVFYLINQIVENQGNRFNRDILRGADLYIMPMANPDGYEYSRSHDRLWRKTRSRRSKRGCIGVDPNRNWGFHWGERGASARRCSDTYRGPKPFSEKNTKAMSDYILHLKRETDLQVFLTLHSYGQYIMYPWGHRKIDAEDWKHLHELAQATHTGFKSKGSYTYEIGSAAKMLYEASGGSDDWAKGSAKIKYAYTVELPDTGLFGFLLPSNQILPVGRSLHAAIYQLTHKLRRMQHTFAEPFFIPRKSA